MHLKIVLQLQMFKVFLLSYRGSSSVDRFQFCWNSHGV